MRRVRSRLPSSVRTRTTAVATLAVAAVLAVTSALLLQILETSLSRSQDDSASARARDLASLASVGALPPRLASIGDNAFIQVVDENATVLTSTANVAGRPPQVTFAAALDTPAARTVYGLRDDQDLENYRVTGLRAQSPSGPVTVYVANSLELVTESIGLLRKVLALGIPIVVVLFGLVTWRVVGWSLRPVESIRSQVADISDAGSDRRVPVPTGRDEISDLASTMNEMLDRLATASARDRAFTADASHELQSPLTRFRTQLEVALAFPSAAPWSEVAEALLADSADMERLVRDLLFLAREDDRSTDGSLFELIDLDDVVLEEAARVGVGLASDVDTSAVSAAPVRGSREQLGRLARNLLENAVRHAASRVQVSLTSDEDTVLMVVRDDGPGVAPDQRGRIFDRFVRLDDARSRDTGGTGLGLAIVDAIARRHGGTVRLEGGDGDTAPVGATFLVRLPSPTCVQDGFSASRSTRGGSAGLGPPPPAARSGTSRACPSART